MSTVAEIKDRLLGAAHAQAARYEDGQQRPLGGYVGAMAAYAGMVAALAATMRASGKQLPDGLSAGDLALSAVSTHKISRLIAKDPVTSPLRAPFTAYRGTQGPAELSEDVRGEGGRKAVGELLTCPFCIGMWVATGLTAGLILLPRTTRIAMGTFTALAGADMLQFMYAWLEQAAH